MVAFLDHRDRRRVGDDLQRARPGARDEEPGHRQALHAQGPQVFKMRATEPGCSRTGSSSRGDWIKERRTRRRRRSSSGTFQGWAYCRDHYKECVNIVLSKGRRSRRGTRPGRERGQRPHLAEQVGVGIMSPAAFKQTAKIAQGPTRSSRRRLSTAAYRSDLAKKAVANLQAAKGIDVYGKGFKKKVDGHAQGRREVATT